MGQCANNITAVVLPEEDMWDTETQPKVDKNDEGSELSDSLSYYMQQIAKYKTLTRDEELSLFDIYYQGKAAKEILDHEVTECGAISDEERAELTKLAEKGEDAKERILYSNLRWVVSIAKRHAHNESQLLDVIQDGNVGLIRALDKFDVTKGVRFSTYAFWTIRLEITHGPGMQTTIIYPPQMVEKKNKVEYARERLSMILGRPASDEEIASELNVTMEFMESVRTIARPTSLDVLISGKKKDSETNITQSDNIPDNKNCFAEVHFNMMSQATQDALSCLSDKELKVIILRFGINDGKQRTLSEVGKILGRTRERIRQIETKALKKLQSSDIKKKLAGWLEDD